MAWSERVNGEPRSSGSLTVHACPHLSAVHMSTPKDPNLEYEFSFQGANVRGIEPRGDEGRIFVFCALLREAVYSYPINGTIKEEFDYYLEKILEEWKV